MAKTHRNMSGEELLGKVMQQSFEASNPESDEDENEDEEVEYSKEELVDEHKRLIKVLRSGDKQSQQEEADRQEKELQELMADESEEEESES